MDTLMVLYFQLWYFKWNKAVVLLSKNIRIKIYRTLISPNLLYGSEIWSLTLLDEHQLMVFEKRVQEDGENCMRSFITLISLLRK